MEIWVYRGTDQSKCPRCKSGLLTDGVAVWCAGGSSSIKRCTYGMFGAHQYYHRETQLLDKAQAQQVANGRKP